MATTEMRLMLIHTLDLVLVAHPAVHITAYVDDVATEMASTRRLLRASLASATAFICDRLVGDGLEISSTKSVCSASKDSIGRELAAALSRYGFRFKRRVKSLGTGLAAGVRRNTAVAMSRLRAFKMRRYRFRRLRQAGVDTGRLLRTGGASGMTYDSAPMGVSPALLQRQRVAAAEAAAPAAGTSGQSVDLAFAIDDDSHASQTDPAFAAHAGPIGKWALAAWEGWLPRGALLKLAATAKRRLAAARNVWATVHGPAASFVASASRLGWIVHDAFSVTLDNNRSMRFDVDSLAAVAREVANAVRRWRWRRVEAAFPHLDSGGCGAGVDLVPIKKLLASREQTDEWNAAARGGLRSAFTGRQWPQQRLYRAGLAVHNRCCLCLQSHLVRGGACADDAAAIHHALANMRASSRGAQDGSPDFNAIVEQLMHLPCSPLADRALDPTIIVNALELTPVGNLTHRILSCEAHAAERGRLAPPSLVAAAASDEPPPAGTLTRALLPSALTGVPPPPLVDTFEWVVAPAGGAQTFKGIVYTDGSGVDPTTPAITRLGWSFVVADDERNTIATARGAVPEWIGDVPGAEGWALLQAIMKAEPGCIFKVDCKHVVDAVHRGPGGSPMSPLR